MAAFDSSFLASDPYSQPQQQVDISGWPDPYASGDIPTPIAPARPNATTPTAAGVPAGGILSPASAATAAASSPGASAAAAAVWSKIGSLLSGGAGLGEAFVENGVFILIGLLLIGAGIFSFKPVQDTGKEFAKGALEGAKGAAAAAAL
jgi:hypothetical protein